jgi:putative ABC transport system permease protein
MFTDYLKLAWENIAHRKLRSILTIIGIVIGIAAVVALISLGQGVKKVITDEFMKAGTDKIYVLPGGGFSNGPPGSTKGFNPLTERDAEIIKRVNGVNEVTGILTKPSKIEINKKVYFTSIVGLPLDSSMKLLEESYNFEYVNGRKLKTGDKYKIVVGSDVARGKTFDQNVVIGIKLRFQIKNLK